jgi:DNA excision repair protein ERCC-2
MGSTKKSNTIKISVRNLVELILRSGDLVVGFSGSSRNAEAIKAHQKLQKNAGDNYCAEVALSYIFEKEEICLQIGGRADGIIIDEDGVIIDEIKTTTRPLEYIDEEYNILHWAQAKCYAYIYAAENNLEEIDVQITYYQLDSHEVKQFKKTYKLKALEDFFYDLVNRYLEWAEMIKSFNIIRDKSIKELKFPFNNYREGQRKLAVSVYTTIKEKRKLFAQAPTGIGKTIASTFPSVKAVGEGNASKIFYLTAKTITRTIAEKAFYRMKKDGLRFKTLTLTAKDKICLSPDASCNSESCKYAKGHFDRVNNAIKDIFINEDTLNREIIEKYAKKYDVCPFEFSLDLSFWCDCIICDYNYVFDPRVYLRRFFDDNGGDYVFLVDEAHNLVDRSREMFSAELFKKDILELKKKTKEAAADVSKSLNKLNSFMVKCRKLCGKDEEKAFKTENGFYLQSEAPDEIYPLLRKFIKEAEVWLLNNAEGDFREELLELYFAALSFLRTAEGYDERYVTYCEKIKDDVRIKLFCLDPSYLLSEAMKRGKASILFSATLTPIEYFMKTLGGEETSYRLILKSPFKQENLCLLIDNKISTKYRHREFTYDKVTKAIEEIVKNHRGNYLVFFPSYRYMEEIYLRFIENNYNEKFVTVIKQTPNMTEKEREEFLSNFDKEKKSALIGFAVMGGIFGEGIDLTGDMLSGAIIVGVGLPQICFERNIIKDYFDREKNMGFEYAYIYPGMNKVMQAVGRVIRTDKDRGVVMLIDERFSYRSYRILFPEEWNHAVIVKNLIDIETRVNNFWNEG